MKRHDSRAFIYLATMPRLCRADEDEDTLISSSVDALTESRSKLHKYMATRYL
jgi:hypothetical protein